MPAARWKETTTTDSKSGSIYKAAGNFPAVLHFIGLHYSWPGLSRPSRLGTRSAFLIGISGSRRSRAGPVMTTDLDQARSKRSRFITLVHAATKSFTNFSFESAHA